MISNEFLINQLIENGTIILNGSHPVKGIKYAVPVGFYYQNYLNQPALLNTIVTALAQRVPLNTVYIAGLGDDSSILAQKVAEFLQKDYVPLETDENGDFTGIQKGKLLVNKNIHIEKMGVKVEVVLIRGVIATGNTTREGVELIEKLGGCVKKIITVFDYEFNLKKKFTDVSIEVLVTPKLITEMASLPSGISANELHIWVNAKDNQNRFRFKKETEAIAS